MRNTFKVLFVTMMIGLLGIWPALSYADWNNQNGHNSGNSHNNSGHFDGGHGHDGHQQSFIGVNLGVFPNGYVYGSPYYPADNVLVSPPVYQPVVINGVTYYLNDGTYYIYNGNSYQPAGVPLDTALQPVADIQPAPPVVQGAPEATAISPADVGQPDDSITINIPNAKGGYTSVTLKKSGTGYIGPQGEFYPKFPKVSELEVIYGK